MISFSSLSKRRGATLAGVFSLAFSCVLLLCGAGSVPIENFLPQGAMQGDLNAGGHNLTNAATVYATAVSATSVVVSGTLTAPSSFTLPFSKLTSTPTTLSGYGITDPLVLTSGSYANPSWITSLASSKLTGALPAVSGASLTGLTFGQIGSTPTTLAGYGITDAEPALGNPSTDGYVLSSTAAGVRSWIAPGGSLALGSNQGGALTLGGGVLDFAVMPNASGGLAKLNASDGTADGSIAFLGTTDDGNSSVAIGVGSNATIEGIAIGLNSTASYAGGAIGVGAISTGGGAMGSGAAATIGGAIGTSAIETGGGGAVGNDASCTSGFAGGSGAIETGGGANFCGGSYAGPGLAISADEIAIPNGSGYATLTACINSSAPASSTDPGVAGQFAYDANYFYVCVATNTWMRVALSSF